MINFSPLFLKLTCRCLPLTCESSSHKNSLSFRAIFFTLSPLEVGVDEILLFRTGAVVWAMIQIKLNGNLSELKYTINPRHIQRRLEQFGCKNKNTIKTAYSEGKKTSSKNVNWKSLCTTPTTVYAEKQGKMESVWQSLSRTSLQCLSKATNWKL